MKIKNICNYCILLWNH